jgi:hypothetical protein
MILVFDYDGTIVKNSWPGVGEFRWLAIPILRWLKRLEITLILSTCREDKPKQGTIYLTEAICHLNNNGIEFDYYNENEAGLIARFGDCRKIAGDFLFDDKAGFWGWWTVPFIVLWLKLRGVK